MEKMDQVLLVKYAEKYLPYMSIRVENGEIIEEFREDTPPEYIELRKKSLEYMASDEYEPSR